MKLWRLTNSPYKLALQAGPYKAYHPPPKGPHQLLGPVSSRKGVSTGSWRQPEPGHSLSKSLGDRMASPVEVPVFSSRVKGSIQKVLQTCWGALLFFFVFFLPICTSWGALFKLSTISPYKDHRLLGFYPKSEYTQEIRICRIHWPDPSTLSTHSGRCNSKSRPVYFRLPLLGTPAGP